MKSVKALLVAHDEKTRLAVDDILSTVGHKYDTASCLAEAKDLLASDGYAYVLTDYEISARVGGTPRMQNTEHLLAEMSRIKRGKLPPVVIIANRLPEVDDEDKFRWAADMKARGATTFICRPFRTGGRTLDRVIEKLLAGQSEGVRLMACPPAAEPAKPASPAEDEASKEKWLTVTQAAELLMHDVPGVGLAKARSRISTAASRKEFKFDGTRKDRRIEPDSFAAWRLKQRDRDLDEEDEN